MSVTASESYQDILQMVTTRAGLNFPLYRLPQVEAGVARAMRREGFSSPPHFAQAISHESRLFDELVAELTIGETYFFRESGQLDYIRDHIVPEQSKKKGESHCLRLWSCGCASGEEPYSLAILLNQAGYQDRYHILATDISKPSLERARAGVYGPWSFRGIKAESLYPYVKGKGADYVVQPTARRNVVFEHLNLAFSTYPSPVNGTCAQDVILCRNVLIYFTPLAIEETFRRLADCLSPDGWLLTSASDPMLPENIPLERVMTSYGVFYKKPGRASEPKVETKKTLLPRLGAQSTAKTVPSPIKVATEAPAPIKYSEELVEDAVKRIWKRADLGRSDVEQECVKAVSKFPLSAELHYLHAILLLERRQEKASIQALRRVIYLNKKEPLAHFTLGTLLRYCGDLPGARIAFRRAEQLCDELPSETMVPFSEGESCGALKMAARAQLKLLEGMPA